MHTYRVTIGETAVRVRSEWSLESWRTWLSAYGKIDELDADQSVDEGELSVTIGASVGAPENLDNTLPVALHAAQVGLRSDSERGPAFIAVDRAALYLLDTTTDGSPHLYLNYPEGAGYRELDGFQIVRGYLSAKAEAAGHRRLHGAGIAREGQGLIFVGDSLPFAFSALDSLAGKGSFVGGHHLHVDSGSVYGRPLAVALSQDIRGRLPRLHEAKGDVVGEGYLVWPGALAEALGSSCTAEAPVGAAYLCDVDINQPDVTIEELSAEARDEVIEGPATSTADPQKVPWLVDELGLAPPPRLTSADLDVPWFRVTGNPWSSAWPASM